MTNKSIRMFDTPPMLRRVLSKGLMTAIIGGGAAFSASAQCTVPTVTAVATTAATCPGNGVINIDATGGPSLQYSIQSGPTSVSGSNSSGDFLSMAAGTYVVRIYNPEDDGCYTDTTVTIANDYTSFSFTTSVSDVCAGTTAGTINVSTTAGSSTPLQVAYWQGAPSASDASLTYGTTFTHVVPESAFGTWNVRVKDACGEAITQQVNVASLYPTNLQITDVGYNVTPTECVATSPNIDLWVRLESNSSWITVDMLPSTGVDVDVYEAAAPNYCDVSAATFKGTQTMTASTGDKINVEREKQLIFVMRTPCGQTDTFCYNGVINQNKNTAVSVSQTGCPSTTYPEGSITLNSNPGTFMIPPIFHELLNSSNVVIDTITTVGRSHQFTVEYGEGYTVRVTDACGDIRSSGYTSTPGVGDPVVAISASASLDGCTNESGKVTLRVTFGGYFPGLSLPAVNALVTSGDDAGVVGVRSSTRTFYFYNMTPGATNTIRLVNPTCDDTAFVNVTVPTTTAPKEQEIELNAAQLCDPTGPGKGTLSVEAKFTGAGWAQVKIYKLGTSTPIYTGPAGDATLPGDFPVGKYYANMEITGTSVDGYTCPSYMLNSDTVEIFASGSLPSITKKVPMVCENPVGSASEAKLSLTISGAGPFGIDYKEEGATLWSTWPGTSGFELITDLTPGITYNLRITDNCGAITTENATMGSLGAVTFENTKQPCIGEPFTIVAPRYANSVYSWEKDGVALSSTTNQIVIPVFAEANTGTYTCEIIIDNCLIRTAVITLYSQMCDSALGTLSISGNVFNDGNGMSDDMVNGTGTNAGGVLYAALTNNTGIVMGSIPVNADGTYTFTNLAEGDYKVVITNGKPAGGSTVTEGTLPPNWVNTGDNIGLPTAPGSGTTIDGVSEPTITLTTSNVSNVNFGVNQRPESYDKTQNVTGAPVVGVPVVLTQPLTGSDKEDTNDAEVTWNENPIVITSLPTNGFDLVYNGTTLELGDTIRNYNPTLLTVVPTAATPNGADETSFEYATVDSATSEDLTPAIYEILFSEPLPVTLVAFNAVKNNSTAVLTWTTASERNNRGFAIERKANNEMWSEIGFVATAAEGGNSQANIDYSFVDTKPATGSNQYRLKQMDTDGKTAYSQIKTVQFTAANVISLQPNPAKQYVSINGLNGSENIRIFDAVGRLVKEANASASQVQINLDGLAEGTYQVTIYNNDVMLSNQKLVISK